MAKEKILAWRSTIQAVAVGACVSGYLIGTEVPDLILALWRSEMVER